MASSSSYNLPMLVMLAACFVAACLASDADPLQDFCVGLPPSNGITVNGLLCKNTAQVTSTDFKSSLLRNAGNTTNPLGSAVQLAFALTFPALNTQGLSIARLDFAPKGGLIPPHVHPRATEVLFLVQGELLVGFVSTTNTLFQQTLHAGDLFVFPRGLVHFQLNVGNKPALAISALNSQNPGASLIPQAVFAAQPPLPEQVLMGSFGINHAKLQSLIAGVKKTL